MYPEVTLFAYLIDKLLGEFSSIRHPVMMMGDYIKWFEKHFYKDTIFRGTLLTLTLILIVWLMVVMILSSLNAITDQPYLKIIILSIIASTTIASNMLYVSVKDIIANPQHIKYLVSRDTQNLSHSNINKAAIETYAENLSDGVIAPIFYLLFFGLEGAFVYKAINTLDSMVGYRNERYEKFGKVSAILDDMANYVPARVTALLIAILMRSKEAFFNFYTYGKRHESPNAGHPISAMALSLGVKLGGATSYFGKMKPKPYFGKGKTTITTDDIHQALSFQVRLDILLILSSTLFFTGRFLWV